MISIPSIGTKLEDYHKHNSFLVDAATSNELIQMINEWRSYLFGYCKNLRRPEIVQYCDSIINAINGTPNIPLNVLIDMNLQYIKDFTDDSKDCHSAYITELYRLLMFFNHDIKLILQKIEKNVLVTVET